MYYGVLDFVFDTSMMMFEYLVCLRFFCFNKLIVKKKKSNMYKKISRDESRNKYHRVRKLLQ